MRFVTEQTRWRFITISIVYFIFMGLSQNGSGLTSLLINSLFFTIIYFSVFYGQTKKVGINRKIALTLLVFILYSVLADVILVSIFYDILGDVSFLLHVVKSFLLVATLWFVNQKIAKISFFAKNRKGMGIEVLIAIGSGLLISAIAYVSFSYVPSSFSSDAETSVAEFIYVLSGAPIASIISKIFEALYLVLFYFLCAFNISNGQMKHSDDNSELSIDDYYEKE